MQLQILDRKSKGQLKCLCEDCSVKNRIQGDSGKTSQGLSQTNKSKKGKNKTHKENIKPKRQKKNKICNSGTLTVGENNNTVDCSNGNKDSVTTLTHCQSCQSAQESSGYAKQNYGNKQRDRNDHSQDYGYSSEHNNGSCDTPSASSSLNSSPEGSEVACSEGFCDHEGKN